MATWTAEEIPEDWVEMTGAEICQMLGLTNEAAWWDEKITERYIIPLLHARLMVDVTPDVSLYVKSTFACSRRTKENLTETITALLLKLV